MEPMSTYVKDLAEYPDPGLLPNMILTIPPAKTQLVCSLAVNLTIAKLLDYNAGKSFRDLHVITLAGNVFVAAEAYYKLNDPKALERFECCT